MEFGWVFDKGNRSHEKYLKMGGQCGYHWNLQADSRGSSGDITIFLEIIELILMKNILILKSYEWNILNRSSLLLKIIYLSLQKFNIPNYNLKI